MSCVCCGNVCARQACKPHSLFPWGSAPSAWLPSPYSTWTGYFFITEIPYFYSDSTENLGFQMSQVMLLSAWEGLLSLIVDLLCSSSVASVPMRVWHRRPSEEFGIRRSSTQEKTQEDGTQGMKHGPDLYCCFTCSLSAHCGLPL